METLKTKMYIEEKYLLPKFALDPAMFLERLIPYMRGWMSGGSVKFLTKPFYFLSIFEKNVGQI